MMKMEKSSESMFNTDARAEDSKVPAKEIGREFVRHYYTMLSEKPNEAGRFYSHESYFMHNDMPEVCGTESIQKAIQQLNFQDCKARIYSISGTNTVNNGLVLQVCGELALKGSAKRRFCQTFVLYPQSPKKFYVHDDVFQWLDKAFGDPIPQQKVETEESDVAFTNEQQLNGHKPASLSENITIDSPNDVAAEPDRLDIHQNEKHLEDYVAPASPGVVEEVTKKQELPAVAEIETKVQETGPKSWAKMVSSGTAGKPVTQNTSYQNATQLPPAPPRQPHPPPTNKPSNVVPAENRRRDDRGHRQPSNRDRDRYQQRENGNRSRGVTQRSELTLFVSNIPRTDPISWEGLESELRGTFEKFGKVKEVSIPKTVKDPQVGKPDRIYVFVDMDSQDDIDSVFNNCRSDDHGRKYLEVNLPIVNYVGEVNVSNRKDDERNSGPHSRGFDNRGGSRGNFGGSGGARRGGGGGNQDGRGGGGQRRGGGGHDHRDNNPK